MNESTKTAVFAGVAGVSVLLAVLTMPRVSRTTNEEGTLQAGSLLFQDTFSDASKAASLKITQFDEAKSTLQSFEVAKDKDSGLWKLPSKYDYPADATEQVQKATTPLLDLKVLEVVTTNRADQALYGVLEPNEKLDAGATGVGLLVNVADEKGKNLASLVIGKEDSDRKELRYVRIPTQDVVYRVELDEKIFATDFKKWIKADLLGVKSFDITGIGFRDYEIERTQNGNSLGGRMSFNMDADVSYDTTSNKWKLDKLVSYETGGPTPTELKDGEELKSDKLNEVRNAAQGLQIVDVRRKPQGLAADLKAEKALLESNEAMLSLFQRGFIPQEQNGATEILATSGETILSTKDGIQYTLRFGEQRVSEENAAAKEGEEAEKKDADSAASRERFLLVTAKLDESKFPLPELQAVPETIEDLKKLDAEKAAKSAPKNTDGDKPADGGKDDKPAAPADAQPSAEAAPAKPAGDDPGAPKAADEKPAPKPEGDKADAPAAEKTPEPTEPKSADEPKENNECGPQPPTADAPAAQEKPPEPAKADAAAAPAEPTADPAKPQQPKVETEEELKDRLNVVREEITKSNQRLLDARNDKLAAARKQVQELNAKFADWYYLINESSYKQLKLKKDDFVGLKSATPAALPGAGGAPFNFQAPGLPPTGVPSN